MEAVAAGGPLEGKKIQNCDVMRTQIPIEAALNRYRLSFVEGLLGLHVTCWRRKCDVRTNTQERMRNISICILFLSESKLIHLQNIKE